MVRRLFKVVLPVGLLAASLAGAGYLRATKPAVEPQPAVERVWTVSAEPVRFADHQPTLQLYGEVVAGRDVTLRPLLAGEVVETSPKLVEGGRFDSGELVVRIDPFEAQARLKELHAERREARARRAELLANVETERAMLDHDRRQLELAGRDVARREQLRGSQAGSEKALDDARMALTGYEAALIKREQTIALLDARLEQQDAVLARLDVAIDRAGRDLANSDLKAPFAGFVTDVEAAVGKRLGVGDPIARLIDQDRLEVRFHISDADFGRLWEEGLIGRELEAHWHLGGATFAVQGRVARVDATIDPASGGIEVFAEITANPDRAPLRPGAFVEVLLPDRAYPKAVELPLSALYDGHLVYAVTGERLQARPVDVVAQRGERIFVRGELEAGEPVVTSRLAEIGPGLKVRIRN